MKRKRFNLDIIKRDKELELAEKDFFDKNNKERPSSAEIGKYSDIIAKMKKEVARAIVGQEKVVDSLIRALICDGHVLLEGVPGIAKTLAIRTLAVVSGCSSKRVQFTVDLLPSDIVGITTYTPGKGFETVKGPIFANFVIADEINRSPPKCVLGDTPVIMENGEISDIKRVIRKYNGKRTYKNGNESWIIPRAPLKLLAFNPEDGKIKPEEVKYLYKQKTTAPYHQVILKSGRNIKTSSIHPFFSFRDGRICNVEAKLLRKGDCVLVPRRLDVSGDDLLHYDNRYLEKSKIIYKEIERRRELYNSVQVCLKERLNYLQIKERLNVADKDEFLVKTFMKIKSGYLDYSNDYFFSEAKQFGQIRGIKRPVSLSKELAQFMAILIAEGSVNKSYFYLTMKDREIPELFIRIIKDLFGLEVNLLYDNNRRQYRVAFRSDALITLLRSLGYEPHVKAGNKSIPSFILTANNDIIREFLRVYYECDGGVSRDCVKVSTKSKKIANVLSYLLLRMGFVAKINRELSRTKIGNYSYKRYFYNLRLYGGELYDFSEKIGFYSDKNRHKISHLMKNIDREKVDLIPGMHKLIRSLRKDNNISHKKFYSLTGMHAHNLENPKNALMHSRSRLKRIVSAFGNNNIKKIVNGDFYCDFVKENKVIVPKKEYWLYDFSMKNTHSFVAGFGGIISHNTQSALIEAMQEKQVTLGKETYPLPLPFFVMANQNPLESSGVYTLPEAQIDRFLFKVIMGYPEYNEEAKIMEENITLKKFEEFGIKAITSPAEIIKMQHLAKRVYLGDKIKNYILEIVRKTRQEDFKYGEFVEWGSSPRASIALFIASKAKALMNGRNFVIPKDIKDVSHEVLRHRLILSYRARAEKITPDIVIDEIFNKEVSVK